MVYDYTMKNEQYYHQQCHNMARLVRTLRDNLGGLQANGHPKWKEVDLAAHVGVWKHDACSAAALGAATPTSDKNDPLERDLLTIIRGKKR